ncbi:MAG: TIGR02453 family protein [Roseivivax sp.]|nr:TIGR02453 family protein [Roseivivax sp.]
MAGLIGDARTYLAELDAQNTRDWFTAQKARYETALRDPALALLETLAPQIAEMAGAPVTTKLFRPQRDVRFSRDKTPYHTHLHMMWSAPGGCGWFFGIAPSHATAGAGVMTLEGAALDRWRAAVDSAEGAQLQAAVAQGGWRVDEPALKRVPAPYPADHPRGALLRHKGFVVWQDGLADATGAADLAAIFAAMAPVTKWLGDHVLD